MIPLLFLMSPPDGDLSCGTQVVSAAVSVLTLYARDGSKAAEIKVKDNSLPAPIPIVHCGSTKVLVRYQDQILSVNRWEIVVDQNTMIVCTGGSGGSVEGRTNARTMNGLNALACNPKPTVRPTTPAPRKRGKRS
jgi:hypothetical protein